MVHSNKLYVYLARGQQEFTLRLAWLLCDALRHLRSLHSAQKHLRASYPFPLANPADVFSFGPSLKRNSSNPLCLSSLWLQMCNMLGLGDMNADQLASKLEETLPVIRSVSEQFKDPVSPFVTSAAAL